MVLVTGQLIVDDSPQPMQYSQTFQVSARGYLSREEATDSTASWYSSSLTTTVSLPVFESFGPSELILFAVLTRSSQADTMCKSDGS